MQQFAISCLSFGIVCRASAYDVYAVPGVLAAAQAAAAAAGGSVPAAPGSRRPSFRAPQADEPAKDASPSPDQPGPVSITSTLGVDDDRRNRRRGSQL